MAVVAAPDNVGLLILFLAAGVLKGDGIMINGLDPLATGLLP